MGFHYVDALDFRHLAMKVTEKVGRHDEAAIEKAIEESWLLKENHELAEIWERSSASREQLVGKLQDWCHRAEASGVAPLVEFSHRLRSYA